MAGSKLMLLCKADCRVEELQQRLLRCCISATLHTMWTSISAKLLWWNPEDDYWHIIRSEQIMKGKNVEEQKCCIQDQVWRPEVKGYTST